MITAAIRPAVEVRQRHRGGRAGQQRDGARRRPVETAPQRQQVERQPLRLRDVRVIRGVCQVERREGVGERRDATRRAGEHRQVARQQVGGSAESGKLRRTSQL